MRRLRSVAERCVTSALVCCFGFVPAIPIWAAEVGHRFSSVDAFVKAMPQGGANVEKGYGCRHLLSNLRDNAQKMLQRMGPQMRQAAQQVVVGEATLA